MLDTQAINQAQSTLVEGQDVWLFGYGSLIYKVDFEYLERKAAYIENWVRRFWQGSHDHRGTPEAPGRVVTLVEQAGANCMGMAYKVSTQVFEHLDHREKNGYLRFNTPLHFEGGTEVDGLVYIATNTNVAFLGPASEADIAEHIAKSKGPSGSNDEYLFLLAQALRELNAHDQHVFTIERYLLAFT